MNKAELKKFAVEARRDLINKVSLKAEQYGITKGQSLKVEENYGQLIVNNKPYPLEMKHAFQTLQQKLNTVGYDQLIDEVAYSWFNRIIAIRYMEVNNYLPDRVNVLSSSTGKAEPDILLQFETMNLDIDNQQINELLQKGDNEEAYRRLYIAQCNSLNNLLPFLFEKIADYTELLLPDYLLDSESIINNLVQNASLTESFGEVEVIGWLYQFYNSEPKKKVFANLKKNKKIEKNDIPAATQLFTPKWIVQYMVENSLGQLWLESYPNSPIKEELTYYVEPSEQEEKVKQVITKIRYKNVNPEEITIIDPCCGSGHILVYAFELLYQMYEEAGYPRLDIPQLILEKNLYGIDIDYRAVQLSSFALIMKAREKSRRIFRNNIKLNIFEILETNNIDIEGILRLLDCNNQNELRSIYNTFVDAKNYGSLIIPKDINYDKYIEMVNLASEKEVNLENYHMFEQISEFKQILLMCKTLVNKYDISITNPPYMGSRKAMNKNVKEFVKKNYPKSKSDLYACFIERCISFNKDNGLTSLVTQHSFMFTDDYKNLREYLLDNTNFLTMCHLGTGSFPEINGEVVQTTSFVLRKTFVQKYRGKFIRLVDYDGELKPLNVNNPNNHYNKYVNGDFKKIKGFPLSYWMSKNMKETFLNFGEFDKLGNPRAGITTGDNGKFVRFWAEVNYEDIGFNHENLSNFHSTNAKYVPYNKGGKQRKWYGNNEFVLKFDKAHYKLLENQGNHLPSRQYYFRKCITWSDISGRNFAARFCDNGFVFDVKGSSGFPYYGNLYFVLALLNSCLTPKYIDTLNPTLTTQVGDLKRIPVADVNRETKEKIDLLSKENVDISKDDWDSSELSWDFMCSPLVLQSNEDGLLSNAFSNWENYTKDKFFRLKENEEMINRIFIDLYKLEDELEPGVEEKYIPLSVANREKDSKSLLSYFIGCLMGRYSLDCNGLACAGGDFDQSEYKMFKPNKYGLIQLTENYYFDNDIIIRLREFLSAAFSPDTVDENMQWLAESLKTKKSESFEERLRRYFLDEFFKDHCKTYQNRPIYWLVDSGKNKGLRTLIYMHRYQPDTMATIRFEHLQEIQSKYQNEIDMVNTRLANPSLSATDRRGLEKSKIDYQKKLEELQDFDKDLAIYANEHIPIDLDDGVIVNYAKFDKVLAKIK